MEIIASYSDEKLLREHPPIMDKIILPDTTAAPIVLKRGTVIGLNAEGLNVAFGKDMTTAMAVLAETIGIPAKSGTTPGESVASVYVHAAFMADQLIFAVDATEADIAVAVSSLKTIGCYAI